MKSMIKKNRITYTWAVWEEPRALLLIEKIAGERLRGGVNATYLGNHKWGDEPRKQFSGEMQNLGGVGNL